MKVDVDIEIDDVIENFSLEEVLDEYELDDIIGYVQAKQKSEWKLYSNPQEIKYAIKSIAATRVSPNLLSCKDTVQTAVNEIIDELF